MPPAITVIIPTRSHSQTCRIPLQSLALETGDPARFEVLLVVDGEPDAALQGIGTLPFPFRVKIVGHSGCGAASARNRGVAEARTPLVLFLDDDMEASPGLIDAHLAAHASGQPAAVLGSFNFPNGERRGDRVWDEARQWWDCHFARLACASHHFTFRDFCTGNVSLPRSLFLETGGFDERFGRNASGEDWEFGFRLLQRNVPFVFAPEARTIHHTRAGAGKMLSRAIEDGRGHRLMASLHPEMVRGLPLPRYVSRLRDRAVGIGLRLIWFLTSGDAAERWRARLSRLRDLPVPGHAWWLYRGCRAYFYWLGARSGFASFEDWRNLLDGAVAPARSGRISRFAEHAHNG